MTGSPLPRPRPLSPHLQIYRPTLTMTLSIVHRITGMGLYLGTLLIAWWLIAASSGPNSYAAVEGFFTSIIGKLVLFGYTWALIHHMFGGIRHLFWDLGYGFGAHQREVWARASILGSIFLTILIWAVGMLAVGPR
jgi:succinate dehydrogenase / fumarate reductase cytochrome b subunit